MKFLCIYKPSAPEGGPPHLEDITKMEEFTKKSYESGVLLATEGCMPSVKGARLRLAGGKFAVTDGPFTESKELVAGFALLRANSKAEAIEYVKEFMQLAGDGVVEIRQIYEPADIAALGGSPGKH